MNRKILIYISLCCIALTAACTSKTIGTKSDEGYSEDLTKYHPNYEDSLQAINSGKNTTESLAPDPEEKNISGNIDMESQFAITDSINLFLDDVTDIKREENSYQGVTIQVYSGLNRTQANEAKAKVYDALPDSEPRLVYDQPNYKVKVGRYFDRLEAQKDYSALREKFPLVLVVPEKFKVVE